MYFKIIQQNKIKKCLKTRKIENQVGDKQSDKKKVGDEQKFHDMMGKSL